MRRVVLALALIIIALPLLLLAFAPSLVRASLKGALRSMGAETVALERVEIDWLKGRVDLRGLEVHASGERVMAVNSLGADWHWADLLSGELRSLGVNGVFVALEEREPGQWGLKGLNLPAGNEESADASVPGLAVKRLDVRESRVTLNSLRRTDTVFLKRLEVTDLDPREPEPASDLFADIGVANGSVTLQVVINDWLERPEAHGSVNLTNIALAQLPVVGNERLQGSLNARQEFQADLNGLSLDGRAGLTAVSAEEKGKTVQIESIEWGGRLVSDLKAENPSLDGSLTLAGARVHGDEQTLELSRVNLEMRGGMEDGLISLASKERLEGLALTLADGTTTDAKVFTWEGDRIVPLSDGKPIQLDGVLGLSSVQLSLPNRVEAQLAGLNWNGSITLPRQPDSPLNTQGELALMGVEADTTNGLKLRESRLSWRGQTACEAACSGGALSLDGRLALTNPRVDSPRINLELEGLDWDGRLEGIGTASQSIVSRVLSIASARYRADGALNASVQDVDWRGSVSLRQSPPDPLADQAANDQIGSDPNLPVFDVDGAISLGESSLLRPGQAMNMAGLEASALSGSTESQLSAEEVDLRGLSLGASTKGDSAAVPASSLQLESVQLIGAEYRPSGHVHLDKAHLDKLVLSGSRVHLIRGADGSMLLPIPLAEEPSAEKPAAGGGKASEQGKDVSPAKPLIWSVGGIVLEGNNRWEFEDRDHEKPVNLVLAPISLKTGSIDSSTRDQSTDVRFKAGFGDDGSIDLAGSVTPLADKPAADIKAAFQHLSLLDISRYLEEAIDHRVTSGDLDASSEFKLADGKIHAKNSLSLYQFEVESNAPLAEEKNAAPASGESNESEQDGEKGSLPLGLALSLLRDSENRIQLDLPIEGDLDNPRFDPSDAIGQAVSSALSTGALLFLQPFGTLAIAGKLALSNAALVRFEPAKFKPGESLISAEQDAYLKALAGKLEQRPGLRIKVCGRATLADAEALKPAPISAQKASKLKAEGKPVPQPVASEELLEALAKRRATEVRQQLRGIHAVEASQLVSCAAKADRSDTGPPRVDLGM